MQEDNNNQNPQQTQVLNNRNTTGETGSNPAKKQKKTYGKLLIFFIFVVILIQYYVYVFEIIIKGIKPSNVILYSFLLLTFHILIFLLLCSFYATMSHHPGEIPLYWGFYIGDDDYKRKRYCLICNAFKPERSHHCSVCNVCVLNMDHHCPWVDNCIGFYNKKFFMQLLFYTSFITLYLDFSMAYFVFNIVKEIIRMKLKYNNIIHAGIVWISYCFNFGFSIIITMFFKFHVTLVINNSTTIESLDKEHKEDNEKFNISPYENWLQVFGKNKLLWFMPLDVEAGRPVGDGLNWETVSRSANNTNEGMREMNNWNNNQNNNNLM